MKISTRIARSDDAGEIVSLWRRFMAEEEDAVPEATPGRVEEAWTERLRKQIADSKILVAEDGCRLIGFLAFIDHEDSQWVPVGMAYIVDIYVVPEARASTAARALFRAAAELLRLAYSETWTNTHVRNTRVRVLLERAGFGLLEGFEIRGLVDQVYYRLDNHARQADAPG